MSTILREENNRLRADLAAVTRERDEALAVKQTAEARACGLREGMGRIAELRKPHPKCRDAHEATTIAITALNSEYVCPHAARVDELAAALQSLQTEVEAIMCGEYGPDWGERFGPLAEIMESATEIREAANDAR